MKGEALLQLLHEKQDAHARLIRLQSWYTKQLRQEGPPERQAALRAQSQGLRQPIRAAQKEEDKLTRQVERLLSRLPSPEEREAIRLSGIRRMRAQDAADVMAYSLRHYQRIKARALHHLDGLLGRG